LVFGFGYNRLSPTVSRRCFQTIPALQASQPTQLETHPAIAHLDDIKAMAIAAMIHMSAVTIEDVLAQGIHEAREPRWRNCPTIALPLVDR
jgi:hypothetical protein